jgi:hypothetical protein
MDVFSALLVDLYELLLMGLFLLYILIFTITEMFVFCRI